MDTGNRIMPRWRRIESPRTAALAPLLAALVVVPIFALMWSSFKPDGLPLDPGFTLENYTSTYNSGLLPLVFSTLILAAGSVSVAMVIGLILVWLLERTDLPFREFFRVTVVLPIATPPLILAISWILLLNPNAGIINELLIRLPGVYEPINIFTLGGAVVVQGLVFVPACVLLLYPSFRNLNPSMEEASFASGASLARTIRRILIPSLRPSILATSAFLTIASLVIFDIAGAIALPAGFPVLSTKMYEYVHASPTGLPQYGRVAALSVMFLLVIVLLALGYQKATRDAHKFVTITGKNFRASRFRLGRWRSVATGFMCVYLVVTVVAPLGVLFWTSLLPYQAGISTRMLQQLSWANYRTLFGNDAVGSALVNTIIISVTAATVLGVLSSLIGWTVARTKERGRGLLDILSFLPIGMSGVMLGLALTLATLMIPSIPLRGSIWVIALGYIIAYLSFSSRLMVGVMHQLHPELEEAAVCSGASWVRMYRRIVWPLVKPAAVVVWVYVVAHAIRELSVALMLQGRDNAVLATVLWGYWEGGRPTVGAALGVLMMSVLFVLVLTWSLASTRSGIREASR